MHMTSFNVSRNLIAAAIAATALWLNVGTATAAIIVTANTPLPTTAAVFTVDPAGKTPTTSNITTTRNFRQTFQLSQSLTVEQIVLAQEVESAGTGGGYIIDLYEVANVNAATFLAGTLVKTVTVAAGTGSLPTTAADAAGRLSFALSGADQFNLLARNSGTQGYAIEVSNADSLTRIGAVVFSNDGVNNYAAGRYYDDVGAGSATRDIGLAIVGSPVVVPEPATASLLGVATIGLLSRRRNERA
jgi:hypothetical protein